ncbi:MAG TPA: transcriptional repressor [Bacteroidales bacterium]|nr:transcriptional repressor [Bacteroidales bacterium]
MQTDKILDKLKSEGLKITPQRVIILKALHSLKNHPTVQQIIDTVHKKNPNISVGTIYKTLDTLVEKGVIAKFANTDDVTRYDSIIEDHHHIYTSNNNKIEDYVNTDLDRLLKEFFKNNSIPNLEIESIKVNISGRYLK